MDAYEVNMRHPVDPKTTGMETASFVLAIFGIICAFVPVVGLICPGLAITLSLLSRGGKMKTEGKAKAALIMGIIGLILSIAALCYTISTLSVDYLNQFQDIYSNPGIYM